MSAEDAPRGRGPRSPRAKAKPANVYNKAVGLLARRDHSQRELKRKLAAGGHASADADAALDRLKSQSLQSDDRFAASLARQRAHQGYGPLRVRAELKSHGIGDAAIRSVLADLDVDWTAIAAEQLRRRRDGAASDAAARAKRAQFLLRRGFDNATVRAVTRVANDDPEPGFD